MFKSFRNVEVCQDISPPTEIKIHHNYYYTLNTDKEKYYMCRLEYQN